MVTQSFRAAVAAVASLLVVALCPAQLNMGQDGNPCNANNWSVTVAKAGVDEGHGWKIENGQVVPNDGASSWPATVPYPPTFPIDPRVYGMNTTSESRPVSAHSFGDVTITFTWRSPSPAPTHAVVRITSMCLGEVSQGGSIWLDNGLDSPTVWDQAHQIAGCSGTQYRDMPVSNGVITVTIHSDAEASADGLNSYAGVAGGNVTADIAPKALSIHTDFEPSYKIGFHDARVVATFPDYTNKEVWSAVTDIHNDGSGSWGAQFWADMWGQWSPLYPLESYLHFSWVHQETPWVHTEYESFSSSDILGMITGGPRTVTVPLTVQDYGDGLSRSATETIKIYSQRSFPVVTSDAEANGDWKAASPIIDVDGNFETNNVTVTMTNSVVDAVTASWTLTLGGELSAKFLELFAAAIKPSASFTWGETATISTTFADSRVVTPIKGQLWRYWFERRKVWKHREGVVWAYDRNGYEGIDDFHIDYFRSGSKQAAAAQDFEDRFKSQQMDP